MYKIQKYTSEFIWKLKEPEILNRYNILKKSQFEDVDRVIVEQLNKVNILLNHAYQNIPYYRVLLENSNLVSSGKIKLNKIDELQKIPFLTKEIIKKEGDRLYSSDHKSRSSYVNSSGGSSGEPVFFLQDKQYLEVGNANALLSYSWRNAEPSDSIIQIWGAERDTFEGKKPFSNYIKEFLKNTITLNCYKMTENDMQNYIETLNKHKPKLIIAYIESIYEIAKYAKENGLKVVQQNAIHGAAGTVHDFMRKEIEEVFNCKVFNHYGSREVGSIASECKIHDGLHILMDNIVVEVVDHNGNPCDSGEDGEIVVTTLNNYSMPLIRYKIGDIGALCHYEKCACGVNYDKLKYVKGRTTEQFKTRSGTRVDSVLISSLFYFHDKIQLFQVIQEDIDTIIVLIVVKDEKTLEETELSTIKSQIYFVMGGECKVNFKFVDNIPKTKTGKFIYTISKV